MSARLPGPLAAALLAALAGPAPAADPPPVVIEGVTVVGVAEGACRPNQTVVIRGSVIERVGAAREVAVAGGSTRVDGRGKYLIPGLWDMHAHVAHDRM